MNKSQEMKKEIKNDKVEILRDLVYKSVNGNPLFVDLYLPKGSQSSLPVIIWLHGGGWRLGDRNLGPDLSRFFAEKGFAMASIEYRLSTEATFPAQIHDVKAAIRWLRSVSDQYGLDPHHIGLWGSSSGGHLASLVATSGVGMLEEENIENSEYSCEVQAVVNGYGPIDFLQMDDHREAADVKSVDPESTLLPEKMLSSSPDSFESLFLGAPINTCPEKVKGANPISYITKGTPPFFILHGLSDTAVPVHQSYLLYDALANKGNPVTMITIEGLGHGFLNRDDLDQSGCEIANLQISNINDNDSLYVGKPMTFQIVEEFFRQNLRG
ncbi:alpha/beta hydrolase fold domain-containing protein [Metabacillus sp. YM-086]|uniref:alpha/beta hydrolase fold domain-containing protein n=1 Tax=Metabacillus sp. YM-086 TaxID=3341729 RepID=UPI003A89E776